MNFKKPKFWDYKKPNTLAYLLLPISYLLKLIRLFKIKSKIKRSKIRTICIGNIYLGGTGKTSIAIEIKKITCRSFESKGIIVYAVEMITIEIVVIIFFRKIIFFNMVLACVKSFEISRVV